MKRFKKPKEQRLSCFLDFTLTEQWPKVKTKEMRKSSTWPEKRNNFVKVVAEKKVILC